MGIDIGNFFTPGRVRRQNENIDTAYALMQQIQNDPNIGQGAPDQLNFQGINSQLAAGESGSALAVNQLSDALTASRATQMPLDKLTQQQVATSLSSQLLNEARTGQIPLTHALAAQQAEDALAASRVKNAKDFQSGLQNNSVITSGVSGVQRLRQLRETLYNPGSGQLAIANAAVLLSQIVEPGLAVRNDDRIAIDTNASAGVSQLGRAINQFFSGELTPEQKTEVRNNILLLAQDLLKPLMGGAQQSLDFWRDRAMDTSGVDPSDVNRILGLDQETADLMSILGGPTIGQ